MSKTASISVQTETKPTNKNQKKDKPIKIEIGTQSQPNPPKKGRRRSRYRRNYIPAGYSTSFNGFQTVTYKDGSMAMTSSELFALDIKANVPFAFPIIPTKWVSTRTATLASTYALFRPTYLHLSYRPAVGTSSNGTVSFGTIWGGVSIPNGISDWSVYLNSTNGGFTTTVWKPFGRKIYLGKNLRANLFPLFEIDPDDVPLWVVAYSATDLHINLAITMRATYRNPMTHPSEASVLRGTASITTSGTDKIMAITAIAEAGVFNTGIDYSFLSTTPLLNNSSGTIIRAFESFVGELVSHTGNTYNFKIDPNIANQALSFVTLIGRTASRASAAISTNF